MKRARGWAQYQVRSDAAMRRHWQLVCCAFSFCWYHQRRGAAPPGEPQEVQPVAEGVAGRGEMRPPRPPGCWPSALRAVRA